MIGVGVGSQMAAANHLLQRVQEEDRRAADVERELRERLDQLVLQRNGLQEAAAALEGAMETLAAMGDMSTGVDRAEVAGPGVEVGRVVGIPNRGADCFWLSALQCLRHTPGFAAVFRPIAQSPRNLTESLAQLFYHMRLAEAKGNEATGHLPKDSIAVRDFCSHAMHALPLSSKNRKLFESDQRQQDTHEFLSQLLDHLGQAQERSKPREEQVQLRKQKDQLESDFVRAVAHYRRARATPSLGDAEASLHDIWNLAFQYVQMEWECQRNYRMNSQLGSIFQGQRLQTLSCSACDRTGLSSAEAFSVEEVVLGEEEDEGFFAGVRAAFGTFTTPEKVRLVDLLSKAQQTPRDDFVCDRCKKRDTTTCKTQYVRLPATLVFHVNRVLKNDTRCATPLDFEQNLELRNYNFITHFGNPMNYNWEPCSTRYILFGAVFHAGGRTAQRGHYYAYLRLNEAWVVVDDDRIRRPSRSLATPMALEASSNEDGNPKVVLLFYQRDDARS